MSQNKILVYTSFRVIISACGILFPACHSCVIRRWSIPGPANVTFTSTFCSTRRTPHVLERMIMLATNVATLWSRSLFFRSCDKDTRRLLKRKHDKSREVPLHRVKECTGKVASARQCLPPYHLHCSESLFTWTTFQGCCAHLLRRNAHSSSRFTKRRFYR